MSITGGEAGALGDARTTDPRAYARIIWRWKFLLLAFLVIIPVAAYLYEHGHPKVYQSSVLMGVSGGQQTGVASLFNPQSGPDTTDLLADARLITTSGVARRAARFLRPAPANPRFLLGSVSATADQTTGFMTITASAGSARYAADIANAFAQALVVNQTRAAVREVNAAITQLQAQMAQLAYNDPGRVQLSQQLARFRALRAAQTSNVQVIDPAIASLSPVAPHVTRSVILALIVALLLGLGTVALAETSDRRIRHPDEAGDFARLPLLSAIPSGAFSTSDPTHEVEESFLTLRSSLTYFSVDRTISSVLITSPAKEDGKTTVAVWLAHALEQAGKDVILLETDLRRPSIARWLGIPASRLGLGSVLIGEVGLDQALLTHGTANRRHGRLRVLPAGPPPPNPSELLGSGRMRDLISELMERSDMLLIDSTPLLTVSDSMPLLQLVSGVVLVARINRTSRDAIARLRFVVDSAGGNALGVVATGARSGGLYVAPGYGYETAYASPNGGSGSGGPRRSRPWRRTPEDARHVGVGGSDLT